MFSFYESSRSTKYGRTSTNMYLQFKWDVENYVNHRFNVKTAKPRVDNKAPMTYTHMFVRPKKLQLELERYSQIQRNNRFLLERLATVHREGAWIDNRNYHEIKSLNTWKRQQEMINLAYNNQIMIARLQDVKARHNHHKLEDEYLINQKYKATIRQYPPNWREIQDRMNRLRKETFKKIFDLKYQRKEYQKSRKKAVERWTAETEKHAAAKAEKDAKKTAEEKKREELAKEKKKETAKERKRATEEQSKKSAKWKAERDDRVKLGEESKKKQQEDEERKKNTIHDVENKKRQKLKEKVEAWKKRQDEKKAKEEESRRKEQEIKRLEANKRIKARLAERQKAKKDDFTGKKDLVKKSEAGGSQHVKTRPTMSTGSAENIDSRNEEDEAGKIVDDQRSESVESEENATDFSAESEENVTEFSDSSEGVTDDETTDAAKSRSISESENQSESENVEEERSSTSPDVKDDSEGEDNKN